MAAGEHGPAHRGASRLSYPGTAEQTARRRPGRRHRRAGGRRAAVAVQPRTRPDRHRSTSGRHQAITASRPAPPPGPARAVAGCPGVLRPHAPAPVQDGTATVAVVLPETGRGPDRAGRPAHPGRPDLPAHRSRAACRMRSSRLRPGRAARTPAAGCGTTPVNGTSPCSASGARASATRRRARTRRVAAAAGPRDRRVHPGPHDAASPGHRPGAAFLVGVAVTSPPMTRGGGLQPACETWVPCGAGPAPGALRGRPPDLPAHPDAAGELVFAALAGRQAGLCRARRRRGTSTPTTSDVLMIGPAWPCRRSPGHRWDDVQVVPLQVGAHSAGSPVQPIAAAESRHRERPGPLLSLAPPQQPDRRRVLGQAQPCPPGSLRFTAHRSPARNREPSGSRPDRLEHAARCSRLDPRSRCCCPGPSRPPGPTAAPAPASVPATARSWRRR